MRLDWCDFTLAVIIGTLVGYAVAAACFRGSWVVMPVGGVLAIAVALPLYFLAARIRAKR
jgi:hypothetical protein